ncbi:hypothetical protein [Streptomyces griseomycini]|uniref:Uncharacterized protein n=1 Tax=Streptomyces griseomycini TaxID=66895 RepID=A0A7W7V9D7_9ACTN|nr:hypothetical protein [Streptomyces griseomycini]MBB4901903.1 hypothetical protein [Streptomyces griseomycini]GGQ17527.1 hypothetical protein GCM10010266_45800 [Streptomyces griseomycini]GGR41118.1 hypothetical protein GCM10015536_53610 [Streptomyces griseomycini]
MPASPSHPRQPDVAAAVPVAEEELVRAVARFGHRFAYDRLTAPGTPAASEETPAGEPAPALDVGAHHPFSSTVPRKR